MMPPPPRSRSPSSLSRFIVAERDHYVGHDGNLFAFSLGQAARYYELLLILEARHAAIEAEFIEGHAIFHGPLPPGETELTPEQEAFLHRLHDLGDELQLQIESFYLFAKILLDRLSQF